MSKLSLFNSFLLAVCLAVMGWVAHKAAESGERIAAMGAGLDAAKEASLKAERSRASAGWSEKLMIWCLDGSSRHGSF
jgi:hypothetical protein